MSNLYRRNKGLKAPKMQKARREMVLHGDQVQQILDTIAASDNPNKDRDHAIIFLAFRFGLRCGEVGLLKRSHFEYIGREIANIPTLKQGVRMPVVCPHCSKQKRIAPKNIGKATVCHRCHQIFTIQGPGAARPVENNPPPELAPPIIEEETIEYVLNYLRKLPEDQEYLFPSPRNGHLSVSHTRSIFNFWLTESGLPAIYSFHSLRHGRGAAVYAATENLQAVKEMLRQKTLSAAEKYIQLTPSGLDDVRRKLGGNRNGGNRSG